MKDRHGNGLVEGCYVRAHPRAPRKPYKGWVTATAIDADRPGEPDHAEVENDRGHVEWIDAQDLEVLKPNVKAKFRRERLKDLAHAVSMAAHRNVRK